MQSERLTYRPLDPADLDAFQGLVQDEHIRRYMMDGNVFPPSWTAGHIQKSQALFERCGVGLWLAYETATGELIGFCGFLDLPEIHDQPELVYALPERFSGRGFATEMARACIAAARARSAFQELVASADEINGLSVRVLEKLGFQRVATKPGAFGPMLLFRLPVGPSVPPAVAAYRRLHESGCFVMPNPWDVGSAVFLHRLGFKALASTSAGLAFARGLPDVPWSIGVDAVLEHLRALAAATPLPLNADFQDGYADDPEGVASQVERCVATGVAGLSIEDATGDDEAPLYERAMALERVRAARRAIDGTGVPVVLTARCEAWLVKHPDAARVALDRLVAFADAGADCLYAPGLFDPDAIATLVKAVAPKPVNVLMSTAVPGLTFARLAELGVRRISVGSALARVAWGAFMRAARELAETGGFDALQTAAPFAELNAMFAGRAPRPD